MDDLLTPVSTARARGKTGETKLAPSRSIAGAFGQPNPALQHHPLASPEDALELLRHEPDHQSLVSVLQYLARNHPQDLTIFDIRKPGPLSAQIIQALVSEIVPNYWALLKEESQGHKKSGLRLLLSCLRSISGVNAILVRLKALIQEARSHDVENGRRSDFAANLSILLDLLCERMAGDTFVLDIWRDGAAGLDSPAKLRPLSQEIVAVFGSGRIVSLAAEAGDLIEAQKREKHTSNIWPADAFRYTKWLAENIVKGQLSDPRPEQSKIFPDVFARALRLGHHGKDLSRRCL